MPEDTASPLPEFEGLTDSIRDLAGSREGDVQALLGLLRLLEQLHREIEDGPFRQALPTSRRALYQLLQDMERAGGWPYIPRLRLRSIMHWIEELEEPIDELEEPED
ncbi:MAG: hypothetical protein HC824_21675 [Synechococcales cyanobacterium RM1_1_8]|nr:hypothetical protein [Synechococcales cyanobacterium RM1_1_8]